MVEVMLVNAVSFLFRMACASISAGVPNRGKDALAAQGGSCDHACCWWPSSVLRSAIRTKGRALLRPNGYGAAKRLMSNA